MIKSLIVFLLSYTRKIFRLKTIIFDNTFLVNMFNDSVHLILKSIFTLPDFFSINSVNENGFKTLVYQFNNFISLLLNFSLIGIIIAIMSILLFIYTNISKTFDKKGKKLHRNFSSLFIITILFLVSLAFSIFGSNLLTHSMKKNVKPISFGTYATEIDKWVENYKNNIELFRLHEKAELKEKYRYHLRNFFKLSGILKNVTEFTKEIKSNYYKKVFVNVKNNKNPNKTLKKIRFSLDKLFNPYIKHELYGLFKEIANMTHSINYISDELEKLNDTEVLRKLIEISYIIKDEFASLSNLLRLSKNTLHETLLQKDMMYFQIFFRIFFFMTFSEIGLILFALIKNLHTHWKILSNVFLIHSLLGALCITILFPFTAGMTETCHYMKNHQYTSNRIFECLKEKSPFQDKYNYIHYHKTKFNETELNLRISNENVEKLRTKAYILESMPVNLYIKNLNGNNNHFNDVLNLTSIDQEINGFTKKFIEYVNYLTNMNPAFKQFEKEIIKLNKDVYLKSQRLKDYIFNGFFGKFDCSFFKNLYNELTKKMCDKMSYYNLMVGATIAITILNLLSGISIVVMYLFNSNN